MDGDPSGQLRRRLDSLAVPAVLVEGEQVRYGNAEARRRAGASALDDLVEDAGESARSVAGPAGSMRVVVLDPGGDAKVRIALEEIEEWLVEASLDGDG